MNVYCLFDKVAEEYGPLFEQKNHAAACRSVVVMLEANQRRMEDYELILVVEDRETLFRDEMTAIDIIEWKQRYQRADQPELFAHPDLDNQA